MDVPIGPLVAVAAVAVVAINLATFAVFGIDKRLAQSRERRIPESTLLMLALLGGSPGAYAGRHHFRHKTRKQPFSDELFLVVVVQVAVVGAALGWFVMG